MSCPAKTALTDSELDQTFNTGNTPGILPSSQPGASDRDGNGMLNKNTIEIIINSLNNSGIIPTLQSDSETYNKKQHILLQNIQAEYCFYESRYKYSLEQLLNAINAGYTNNTPANQQLVQKYLKSTQALNQRLNDLTQIINAITDYLLSATTNINSEIIALDKRIKEQQAKLSAQHKIISSGQATTKLNKEMVKFTEQKSRYSDNLLNMYSFLNIVALGLLIYVYKSASD